MVTLLIIIFVIGTIASLISGLAINPQAREGFARMGGWSVACLLAAIELWRGLRWAYWLAIAMLCINLIGSIISVVAGPEPRVLVGIPIVLIVLIYLLRNKTRERFESSDIIFH